MEIYKAILADVLDNQNLQEHLDNVEGSIAEVDDLIATAKQNGQKTEGYETFKNELYFLKYQILERL
ncbi:hypothetical protein SY85_02770 [Flavisolibacter tropicus]|uniref:Uncharacterized protein n=2 Tax=Flavisolibacter tropicus TaxID=1492898 RepID=A0A172TR87_9BACT|nr:hypothetical protein SY85_02770 [Flavisolibacter tropicus]